MSLFLMFIAFLIAGLMAVIGPAIGDKRMTPAEAVDSAWEGFEP